MAKIGLNSIYYSILTEAADGTPSYNGAKSFGKAISANVSITNNSASLYADDVLCESDNTFQSGTVSLGVDDDREQTFAELLGNTITESGLVTRNANDIAPWVGLGRIIVKLVNNVKLYKAEIIYKCKFSTPSSEANTRGESVEFATPTIEGTIATLANGKWSEAQTFATKAEAIAFIQGVFAASGSTFRVTYDANGGTGTVASVNVNVGSSTTIAAGTSLTPPTGKVFDGWAISSTATEKQYNAGATYYPVSDVTFYAVYVDD